MVSWIYDCSRCLYSTDINDGMCKECKEVNESKTNSNPSPCFNSFSKNKNIVESNITKY